MSDQVLQSRVHNESVTIPNHRRPLELSFYFPHPLTAVLYVIGQVYEQTNLNLIMSIDVEGHSH